MSVEVSTDLKHGLPSPSVWCITEDKNKKDLYIGTDVGVSKYDKAKRIFTHYKRVNTKLNGSKNTETSILDIFPITDNLILVASVDGVYELRINGPDNYHFSPISFYNKELAEKHNRVYKIVKYDANRFF